MTGKNEAAGTAAVDLGDLLDAVDGAVVTLVAGETRLVAHKAVLAATSPVFATMFCDDTLESSGVDISVPDTEGRVLRQLLAYMYTLKAPQLPSMAPQLLAAADTYGLPALKDECEQQVVAQLGVETAAASAVLAVRHSCPRLREAAVAFIKAHSFQVMATQGWADAVRHHPQDLIEVSRLMNDTPAKTSAPATGDTGISPGTQLHSNHGHHSETRVTGVLHHTPPPDDAAVSQLRSLSPEEKGQRLIQAAQEGAEEELRVLLAAGADVGATDTELLRNTALHWAALRGHLEAVMCLVEHGADVEVTNRAQNTPLLLAALRGHAAVVRLLVAFSADPDTRDQSGWTPLHWAAYNGHTEAVAALLESRADIGARNEDGETPLDLARLGNHQKLVQMLNSTLAVQQTVA